MAKAIKHSSVRFFRPVLLEELRVGVAEPEPLLDVLRRLAEALADLLRRPVLRQLRKGFKLVCRVHGQPDRVGGQARLQGVRLLSDLAGHGVIGGQLPFRLQGVQRLQAASAVDDVVVPSFAPGDDQVVHEAAMGEDRGFQVLAPLPLATVRRTFSGDLESLLTSIN